MGKKKRKKGKRSPLPSAIWFSSPQTVMWSDWNISGWEPIEPLQEAQIVLVGDEQFIVFGGGEDEDLT